MEIQVSTAKSLFEEGVQNAKALSSAKDPKDMMDLRAHYAQATTEKMLACAREIAEITTTTQAAFGKLVGEQLTSGSHDMFDAMQKMFKGMPIADQNALGAMQTAHGHHACRVRADDACLDRGLPGARAAAERPQSKPSGQICRTAPRGAVFLISLYPARRRVDHPARQPPQGSPPDPLVPILPAGGGRIVISRASTQRAPPGVSSHFQNGARVFR